VRSVIKIFRRLVIGLGLTALVTVLFPNYIEPLWAWSQSVSFALGQESFPAFSSAKEVAGFALLLLVLGGIIYNAWRDRRLEVLRAEYEYHTGAAHLQQRIATLNKDLARVTEERDQWQKEYTALNKEHTAALVAAKEYEVHSNYGREDRVTLKELRAQFNELLKEKGHNLGFHEAVEVMMAHLANHADLSATPAPTIGVTATSGPRDKAKDRPSLAYGSSADRR